MNTDSQDLSLSDQLKKLQVEKIELEVTALRRAARFSVPLPIMSAVVAAIVALTIAYLDHRNSVQEIAMKEKEFLFSLLKEAAGSDNKDEVFRHIEIFVEAGLIPAPLLEATSR